MGFFKRNKNSENKIAISGPLLIANFETAINNLATAETAKYVAEESEQETMRTINSTTAHNSVYVTPEDLSPEAQAEIVRSSVNAHLQKAQSEQINAFADQQVAEMEALTKQNYVGKKVKVSVLDKKFKPLESVWQDKNTGEVTQGTIKSSSISGVIDDINFEKNVIVLRPSFRDKLLVPDRKYIFVYVINPNTLTSTVELSIN